MPTLTKEELAKQRPDLYYEQYQSPQATRNVQLQVGEPATQSLSNTQASTLSNTSTNNYQLFGNQLMDLMKQYQGMGTKQGQQNVIGYQNQQAQAVLNPAQAGMSPNQQQSMIGAQAGVYDPAIQGQQARNQTFSEQLQGYGDVLTKSFAISQTMQEAQRQAQEDTKKLITGALASNSSIFDKTDPKQLAEIEKNAGYPAGFILSLAQGIKQQETAKAQAEPPKTLETSQGIAQWNPKTGKFEQTGMQPYRAPSGGVTSGGAAKTATNLITLTEAKSWKAPWSTGMSEQEFASALNSETPPIKFLQAQTTSYLPTSAKAKQLWATERQRIIALANGTATTSSSGTKGTTSNLNSGLDYDDI